MDGFEYLGDRITRVLEIHWGIRKREGEEEEYNPLAFLVIQGCARVHAQKLVEVKYLFQTL